VTVCLYTYTYTYLHSLCVIRNKMITSHMRQYDKILIAKDDTSEIIE